MQQIARQVAVAVDNALNFQSAQAYQQQLARERDRLRVLLEVNNAVVSTLDLTELFRAISASLRRVMQHEYTSLALFDSATQKLRTIALDLPPGTGLVQEDITAALENTPDGPAFSNRTPLRFSRADLERCDSVAVPPASGRRGARRLLRPAGHARACFGHAQRRQPARCLF